VAFAYTVTCTFPDDATRDAWLAWLRDGHLADVLAAGATGATVVVLDGDPPRAEARYTFADRAAFEAYERDHAPRLRADGLARFPPGGGLAYARTTGRFVLAG
jgi:hypothetical protein